MIYRQINLVSHFQGLNSTKMAIQDSTVRSNKNVQPEGKKKIRDLRTSEPGMRRYRRYIHIVLKDKAKIPKGLLSCNICRWQWTVKFHKISRNDLM